MPKSHTLTKEHEQYGLSRLSASPLQVNNREEFCPFCRVFVSSIRDHQENCSKEFKLALVK